MKVLKIDFTLRNYIISNLSSNILDDQYDHNIEIRNMTVNQNLEPFDIINAILNDIGLGVITSSYLSSYSLYLDYLLNI